VRANRLHDKPYFYYFLHLRPEHAGSLVPHMKDIP